MVVYDNAPGSLSNMQVNGVIPPCFITLEDGTKMKTESQKALTVTPDLPTLWTMRRPVRCRCSPPGVLRRTCP